MEIKTENSKYLLYISKAEIPRFSEVLLGKCHIGLSYYSDEFKKSHKAWLGNFLNIFAKPATTYEITKLDLVYLSTSFDWVEVKTDEEIEYLIILWDLVDNTILNEQVNCHRKLYDEFIKNVVKTV